MMRHIAVILALVGVVIIVVNGQFENDFIRILVLLTTCAFIFYADVHWTLRWIVSASITDYRLSLSTCS